MDASINKILSNLDNTIERKAAWRDRVENISEADLTIDMGAKDILLEMVKMNLQELRNIRDDIRKLKGGE